MTTFWQRAEAFARVDQDGNVLLPLQLRLGLPEGGAVWGTAFCHTVATPGNTRDDWPPLKRAKVVCGDTEMLAEERSGEAGGVGDEAHTLGASPHTPNLGVGGATSSGGGEGGPVSEDEIILEGLSAALAPMLPLCAPEPAGAGAADPDQAIPASFGEYPLRPRRAITARLEFFILQKFVAAAAQPKFKLTAKWLEETRAAASAAGLVDEGTASSEGLRQVVRAYQTWLKSKSIPS